MHLTVNAALVRRQFHPVNRGLAPHEWQGLEGGRYSPSDVVGPILDSMELYKLRSRGINASAARERLQRKRKDVDNDNVEGPKKQRPMTVVEGDGKKTATHGNAEGNCPCVTKNPKLLVESNDGDCMVCSSCGVVGSRIAVPQHREKACAAEDDKTTHADAPTVERDRFADAALDLKAARQLKEGPKINVVATDRKTFGFAKERVARLVKSAERDREQLSTKDLTRELQLLVRVEKLFKPLEPMAKNLKRYVRVEAYTFFHTYVKHCAVCQHETCRFTGIRDKSLQYLATTCIAAALNQLADGACTIDVDPEQIRAVIDRHSEMDTPTSLRTATREVRLFLERGNQEQDLPACTCGVPTVADEIKAEDETKRVAEAQAEEEGGAFGRKVRTFLRKLTFVEGKNLMEQTLDFYIGKYEQVEAEVLASDLSWPARALSMMEVVARVNEGSGPLDRSPRMRPALLASLGATETAVMKLVSRLWDVATTASTAAGTSAAHSVA